MMVVFIANVHKYYWPGGLRFNVSDAQPLSGLNHILTMRERFPETGDCYRPVMRHVSQGVGVRASIRGAK